MYHRIISFCWYGSILHDKDVSFLIALTTIHQNHVNIKKEQRRTAFRAEHSKQGFMYALLVVDS